MSEDYEKHVKAQTESYTSPLGCRKPSEPKSAKTTSTVISVQEIPSQYRQKSSRWAFWVFWGCFFSRYFRGILGVNSGSPDFRAKGYFSAFFVEIPVGPSRGSVAGRGVVNFAVWPI